LNPEAAADAPTDKRRGVIYTIAPSPLKASLLWIGTDDGLIKLTNDVFVRQALDLGDVNNSRFAAAIPNLLGQPLQSLVVLAFVR